MGRIVWLASYPKSGNTWMRAFLHNLFANAREPLGLGQIGGNGISALATDLRWFRPLDPRPPAQWSLADIAAMRPRAQALIARDHETSVFCKTHAPVLVLQGHPTINMQVSAGAIYIVRNPLDVVLSLAAFRGGTPDSVIRLMATADCMVDRIGDEIPEVLGSWSQNVESWTGRPNPGLIVLRYEDMLDDPLASFGALVRFLRLEADTERLERAIRNASFGVLRATEDRDGFPESPAAAPRFFRAGRAGQWRDVLSPDQVAAVVGAHRTQMARFGYIPEGM